MTRLISLAPIGSLLALPVAAPPAPAQAAGSANEPPAAISKKETRPNVILILTDQQTAGAMSCAGNTDIHTPNMDRLAENGILFSNAYCSSPLSGPSRTAMFTGYYPSQVGMPRNADPMPDSLKTRGLGTLVKESGYDCGYAGKWHVPESSIPDDVRGFSRLHDFGDISLAESCVEFLRKEHFRPFFLVASFDNPHNICEFAREQNLPYGNLEPVPREEWVGLPANFARNPYDADVIAYEKSQNYHAYPTSSYSSDDWRKYRTHYFKLVEKVDAEIGKIVDEIDRQNLWRNTVVIFSSDHGDGAGAHQWNQKSALYEEVINIPLIITLPGKDGAGGERKQLVNNGIDLFASICDWCGVEIIHPGQGGVSFRRVAENAETPGQEYIVIETMFDRGTNSRGWCVRNQQYKYVLYDKGRYREQLFDMSKDRGEMRNLAVEKKYHPVLQEFRAILKDWMKEHKVKQIRKTVTIVPPANS